LSFLFKFSLKTFKFVSILIKYGPITKRVPKRALKPVAINEKHHAIAVSFIVSVFAGVTIAIIVVCGALAFFFIVFIFTWVSKRKFFESFFFLQRPNYKALIYLRIYRRCGESMILFILLINKTF